MRLEVISREPSERRCDSPLLFIHGTGHAAWCWDEHFLPYFADRGFSSHAISLRGHGLSEGADKLKWTRIADYVADVRSVAVRFDRQPVLIGHSLGGLVAVKYIEQYGAAAGVLVAPSPTEGMFWSGLKAQLRNPVLIAKVAIKQDYSVMYATPRLAKQYLFSANVDEKWVEGYSSRFGPESYIASLETIFNLPRTKKVKAPVLVVGAGDDAILKPAVIERTARAFKADYKIFPNIAHEMMLEKGWGDVAEHIADWIETNVS